MAHRGQPAAAPVKLRDVAEAAGVHPGTASRALNEATRGMVSKETVARILEAAERMGYRPNPIARSLKTNRSFAIGVLIPDLTNPLFPPILRGIEDRLGEAGYTPLIANTDNDPKREQSDWLAMRDRQVDGIIAATARGDHRLLDEIAEQLPLVLVNRLVKDVPISAAIVDDHLGAALAVRYLVELGHHRIGHIAGPLELSTGLDRHEGFLHAMQRAGLTPDPELIVVAEAFTEEHGARACRELLDRGEEPTAIAAGNDLLALGCYDVLEERGLPCPERISVTGFNDMPFADRFNPPLTTVRIPHYEIGAAAADLMLEQLTGTVETARRIRLEPKLVIRSSTAAPPA